MSMRPGVTNSPRTSTIFDARAGSILGATAAILPPRIATSRAALMLFRGSTRWPPCSSKSYFCAAAVAGAVRIAAASSSVTRVIIRFSFFVFRFSLSAARSPLSAEILAHIQLARHLILRRVARERERERVASLPGEVTAQANIAAADGSRQITRHEITLMRPLDVAALLPEMQHVRGCAGGVLDTHVPSARQINSRRAGRDRRVAQRPRCQQRMQPIGDNDLVSRRHHVRR